MGYSTGKWPAKGSPGTKRIVSMKSCAAKVLNVLKSHDIGALRLCSTKLSAPSPFLFCELKLSSDTTP